MEEKEEKQKANRLTPEQKDQIDTWLRAGYTAYRIPYLAKNQGWKVSRQVIERDYLPKVRKSFEEHIDRNSLKTSWFNREFRAERAADIADRLYEDIMEGKMYAEEVTTRMGKMGEETNVRPVYFAGMIKNFKDMIDTIGNELGQRKQQVDVNFNKNQNLNLSVLVDRIYQQDTEVDRRIEGAEIIELPPGDDFADDKGFLQVVDAQTPEEVKELQTTEEEDEDADLHGKGD